MSHKTFHEALVQSVCCWKLNLTLVVHAGGVDMDMKRGCLNQFHSASLTRLYTKFGL